MDEGIGFSVEKPVAVWNRELDVDFKGFFKGLTKYALHGVSGQWLKAGEDLIDIASAVGLQTKPAELAWLLIRRSLARAMAKLAVEGLRTHGTAPSDPDGLVARLDLTLETVGVEITPDFFDRPADHLIVEAVRTPFEQWLEGFGLVRASAQAIGGRLGAYFTFALHREWARRPAEYEPIRQALPQTPFSKADGRERGWRRNAAFLHRQIEQPVFDEVFSLHQIYVPLLAYWAPKEQRRFAVADQEGPSPAEPSQKPVVVDLAEHLRNWLDAQDQDDAVRIICGGPGSGKTSFARMFAYELADKHSTKVLFVPLHQFDFSGNMTDAVRAYVRDVGILSHDPLDREEGERRLIIFFDGLDELAMQGKVGQEAAGEFVRELVRTVDRLNLGGLRLQVIVGGRELVIQASAGELRREGQVLHVLPYYVDDRDRFSDGRGLLLEDRRDLWWRKYGELTGKPYQGLPAALRDKAMVDITAQPLLNYLFAFSFDPEERDLRNQQNLNIVYERLLTEVWNRRWGKGRQPGLQQLECRDFVGILEDIGLAAWHGDGRRTSVGEIEHLCERSGLKDKLPAFQKGAEQGAVSLLAAFFFRHAGQLPSGERTFEFTHKSFGEYLTARRIARLIRVIDTQLARRAEDREAAWDHQDALVRWIQIVGPSALTEDILVFIECELRLRDSGTAARWQKTLSELVSDALVRGLPMQRVALQLATFKEMTRQARNAEETLIAALHACALITQQRSQIDWPSETTFGELVKRLQGQRTGAANVLAMQCLAWLDAPWQCLDLADLYNANLEKANLAEARLEGAIFWFQANLREADLSGAHLGSAKLSRTDLSLARLQGANLEEANLVEAILEGANLVEANLKGADLKGANLVEANLKGANLEGADLVGVRGLDEARGLDAVESWQGAKIERKWVTRLKLIAEELGLVVVDDLEDDLARTNAGRRAGRAGHAVSRASANARARQSHSRPG